MSWLLKKREKQKKFLTLTSIIPLSVMVNGKKHEDLSKKIKVALDKAINKVVAEEKARNGYLVVSDKKGNIKKIPAKDL